MQQQHECLWIAQSVRTLEGCGCGLDSENARMGKTDTGWQVCWRHTANLDIELWHLLDSTHSLVGVHCAQNHVLQEVSGIIYSESPSWDIPNYTRHAVLTNNNTMSLSFSIVYQTVRKPPIQQQSRQHRFDDATSRPLEGILSVTHPLLRRVMRASEALTHPSGEN